MHQNYNFDNVTVTMSLMFCIIFTDFISGLLKMVLFICIHAFEYNFAFNTISRRALVY